VLSIIHNEFAAECRRLCFVSGCHLDEPATMRRLASIFQGYEGLEEGPPAMFVLVGPFFSPQSAAQLTFPEMRAHFATLAALVDRFPLVRVRARAWVTAGWMHALCELRPLRCPPGHHCQRPQQER